MCCKSETPHEINSHPPVKRDNGIIEFCYNCLTCGDSKEVFAVHQLPISMPPVYEGTIPEEMTRGREGI